MKPIKVLVVDDSVMFRSLLVKSLESDPDIQVIAQAKDPYEARDMIIKYKPDVMTLDVEMPRMSGIEFLRKLMPQFPIRTVMISSLNAAVFDALEAGAVDFVNKPTNMNPTTLTNFMKTELVEKVKIAADAKIGKPGTKPIPKVPVHETQTQGVGGDDRIVAIGASTGGTEAIFEVVRQFKPDIPGVVIVQHMPPGFTKMYADRLDRQCDVSVKEAQTGDIVMRGRVLIAPGDKQMRIVKVGNTYQVECKGSEKVNGHCPAVDVLFNSVAQVAGNKAIGVILTGMGSDGARGLLAMRKAGALTVGEDEPSCVVYGMPKAAYDIGAVQYQMSLTAIAGKVYSLLKK